ncbi:hypothetical protein HRI_000941100 [Hibiscus trionum]|uniref:CCHC-type domain-containing protein n=1 Tax=Hibiscus trionum TaxID=183268 RepID=A0A9W7H8M8_HIBTR|nr:hypothetical protein HRI_000941100 [Hibiscus trionum]
MTSSASSEVLGRDCGLAPVGRPPDQHAQEVTRGDSLVHDDNAALGDDNGETGQQMEIEDTPHATVVMVDAGGEAITGSPAVGEQKGAAQGKPSFRDMVVGQRSEGQKDNFICDLDVDLEADDVVIGNVGEVPEIKFSERVHCIIDDKLAKSLVVRLLGRSIGYRALHNRVHMMWKPVGEISIIDLDNEYFLVRFAMEAGYERVLSGGSRMIYGSYLTVQPWSRDFSTTIDYPRKLLVWLRLPGLPYRYYSRSIFEAIAGVLEEVVRVDFNTTEGSRGKFARLAVVVDLEKPLIPTIIIDGRHQLIEYEGLSHICFSCGKYGHLKDLCENSAANKGKAKVAENVVPDKTDRFGPWMQAPSRRRRTMMTKDKAPMQAAPRPHPGLRFRPLIVEGESSDAALDVADRGEEHAIAHSAGGRRVKKACAGSSVDGDGHGNAAMDNGVTKEGASDSNRTVGTGLQDGEAAGRSVAVNMKGIVIESSPEVPIASADVIVVEQSTLSASNHTAVRVVDDGGRQPLQESNGRPSAGNNRGSGHKGPSRNRLAPKGVALKGVKARKSDNSALTQVAVKDWANDLSNSLTLTKDVSDARGVSRGDVQWIRNATFEGASSGTPQ